MQKLFFRLSSIAKKRCLKALPDHETSTSIKKRVRRIIPSNQFCPDLGRSSYWLKICINQSEALPWSGQWYIISMEFVRSFLRRHFGWKPVVTSRNVGYFLDKKWGGYFCFFFYRRMRRQRLERKRKHSKKVSSNVFLWVFTLTSGSRKRLCFCGVKNAKTNPGPGCSKQG